MKTCEKGNKCLHFVIEKLIKELGGLGNENGLKKIKGGEQFKEYLQKIERLGELVKEFEGEVVEYFDINGCYPCSDPMQICWGRRKYRTALAVLEEQKKFIRQTEMEVKK